MSSSGRAHERPLPRAALTRAVAAIEAGASYRAALEDLLFELEPEDAHWLMQELRESRGAWAPLARTPPPDPDRDAPDRAASAGRALVPGRALFIGDALSGTPVALGRLGFETTVLGRDPLRLDLARLRARALVETPSHFELDRADGRLPFDDRAFALVVQDGGLPGPATGWSHPLEECARVSAGELVLVADNRLGYKRSAGAHGVFHVLRPLELARAAAFPARGERTLSGYRAALRGLGLEAPEAYALYPHSGQFVHVVALDRERPRLPVGPKERRNRFKVLGARLGLFPVFTPSFALLGRRPGQGSERRIERILAAVAERVGEPPPELDQLVATRGNTAVFLTRPTGKAPDAADAGSGEGAGRWCLHLPLSPSQQVLVERHARALERLPRTHPGVPVPELLFTGELEGAHVTCERRLAGRTAPELSDDPRVGARLLADAARIAAELVVEPARPLDERDFEALLGQKLELVLRHARVDSTLARTRELAVRARAELVGRPLPRVLYHADLRGKHVQIAASGEVLGILDWGTLEDVGLPYVDLFHLAVHERKQAEDLSAGVAWRRVRDRATRLRREAAALEGYAAALDLEASYLRLIEDLYPVLVGAMAERNWDYSRPRWVHEQFGF